MNASGVSEQSVQEALLAAERNEEAPTQAPDPEDPSEYERPTLFDDQATDAEIAAAVALLKNTQPVWATQMDQMTRNLTLLKDLQRPERTWFKNLFRETKPYKLCTSLHTNDGWERWTTQIAREDLHLKIAQIGALIHMINCYNYVSDVSELAVHLRSLTSVAQDSGLMQILFFQLYRFSAEIDALGDDDRDGLPPIWGSLFALSALEFTAILVSISVSFAQ
eukprot:gene30206-37378_t